MKNRFPQTPNSDLQALSDERAAVAFRDKIVAESLILIMNDGAQTPIDPTDFAESGSWVVVSTVVGTKVRLSLRKGDIARVSAKSDSPDLVEAHRKFMILMS